MPSLWPPPKEQAAIADFLDHHARISQRLIRAKRRQIELLNEQKQAIIHQAVTRGLDPDVPLKPSGIDWLGDVPAHWEIRKLKYVARFDNGFPFKPSDWKSDGTPIIRIQNLNGSTEFNYSDRDDIPEYLIIQPGDLLFAWSGNRGTSFGSFIWAGPSSGFLNQHIFRGTSEGVDHTFFYYLLRAVTAHVEDQAHGIIGLVHITKPDLGAIAVPFPPRSEQEAIGAHLEFRVGEIMTTIGRIQREIDLIREYRTRLIADIVTGKLDVRGVELSVIDEADEAAWDEGDSSEDDIDQDEQAL